MGCIAKIWVAVCAGVLAIFAGPASAELVSSLSQDPDTGAWQIETPDWQATLIQQDDGQTAMLHLGGEGKTLDAENPVDLITGNLPLLMTLEEAYVCGEQLAVVVSGSDLTQEGNLGRYVYRRWVLSPEDGALMGEITDTASAEAGGLLPAAVVADELAAVCQ